MTAARGHAGPTAYLSRLCSRWAGSLELLPESKFWNEAGCAGRTSHPSFACAIDRGARRIFAARLRANPGIIIHEMGHVFLNEGDPKKTYEPDWLGWEIVVARRARCFRAWSKQNEDYICVLDGEEREWGDLSSREKRWLIADRVKHARFIGVVGPDDEPLCTRTRS